MTADVPEAARDRVRGLVDGLSELYGGALMGVYLHGLLVLGGFNAERSDIDAVVVTTRSATSAERGRLSGLHTSRFYASAAWPSSARR